MEPFQSPEFSGLYTEISNTTTASGGTGLTGAATLSQQGTWLVSVAARLNGSLDHAMSGTWLVNLNDAANDILLSSQLGSTAKSASSAFGLDTLTLSNPTAAGVITATAAWTDGQSHTVAFSFTAKKIASYT